MRILKKSVERLACRLTPDEFNDRAKQLAAVLEDTKNEESRQKMLKEEMKSKTASLDARRDELCTIVARREELRDVAVEYVANDETGTVYRERQDSFERDLERQMSTEERQQSLKLVPDEVGA